MKGIKAKPILRSAKRLVEAENSYNKTGDRVWVSFLKRESSILLRRAIKFWIKLRLRGG